MKKQILTIATRKSPLALWQAEFVKKQLQNFHPHLEIKLLGLTTTGDVHLATPLANLGGKGLFVKELEQALLDGSADIAVHSLKDMPSELPKGLTIAIICKRGDARDALVTNDFHGLEDLPLGSVIGTSSLRRQCQIKAIRPDIQVKSLRGNVDSRLKKLDNHEFDAIILAAAGLKRLGFAHRIKIFFPPELFVPAVAQGALGIECREGDQPILSLLAPLDDPKTRSCVLAERAFNRELQGGCQIPIAAHATLIQNKLSLTGLVGYPDGSQIIKKHIQGLSQGSEQLGIQLAHDVLAAGANEILVNFTTR